MHKSWNLEMNFIMILIDSIVTFVKRNPLLCLFTLMLALMAPSVLKGIAAFVLYFLLGILLFGLIILLTIRWRFRRLQREMQKQYGRTQSRADFTGESRHARPSAASKQEGEVKVHITSEAPEKRVAKDVGDYVEFEETKETR